MATQVSNDPKTGIDPVEAEIVRHQILAIVEEMAATMRKASGSPAITEANDFSVCLLDAEGEVVSFAVYITLHLGAAKECVANLLKRHPVETISPGDRFIVNDAYLGSAHLNDTGVLTPIFLDGKLTAWAWAEAHLPDYGGWGFGGFSPGITDVYQEGLRMSLIKFVENGQIIPQVESILRDNVRLPDLLMNDVRGLLAAGNVCDHKVQLLAERHGRERLEDVFEWSIASTEEVLRRRIETLPDGEYKSEAWLEHDGVVEKYYRIVCTMKVEGDGLTLDFTGTDPAAAGLCNGGPGAVWGFLLTPIMHQLAWDLPINHGLIRPLEVILPLNTLVNPVSPSGVSGGHLDTGMHGVQPAVCEVLSQALDGSTDPELRSRVAGLFHCSWMTENWFGQDKGGNPFLFFNLDGGCTGGGAQTVCDGLHTAGDLCQPDNHIPDVEWYEYLNPVLFLFRRPWQDSGGPGAYRGGTGTEEAWALWGADSANGTLFGQAAEIPRAGVFGGMPSGGHAYEIWREMNLAASLADGKMAGDYDELAMLADGSKGPEQTGFKISNLPLDRADVVYRTLGGGSGLGDCLDRDPDLVVADVERGLVSADAAEAVYGVVLGDGQAVDAGATESRRAAIRDERRGGELLSHPPGWGTGSVRYAGCDSCRDLVTQDDWRLQAAARTAPAKEYVGGLGGWLADPKAGQPRVTELACRECGTLLDVVVEVEDRD